MTTKCPKCGYERQPEDDATTPRDQCPGCGVFYAKVERPSASAGRSARGGGKRFTLLNLGLAVAGAALMALGAFLPAATNGLASVTYFGGGDGDGLFVVVAAAVVMLGAMLQSRRLVGYPAVAGVVLIGWGLVSTSGQIAGTASLSWGWAVMILGAVMAMSAAVIDERRLRQDYSATGG